MLGVFFTLAHLIKPRYEYRFDCSTLLTFAENLVIIHICPGTIPTLKQQQPQLEEILDLVHSTVKLKGRLHVRYDFEMQLALFLNLLGDIANAHQLKVSTSQIECMVTFQDCQPRREVCARQECFHNIHHHSFDTLPWSFLLFFNHTYTHFYAPYRNSGHHDGTLTLSLIAAFIISHFCVCRSKSKSSHRTRTYLCNK